MRTGSVIIHAGGATHLIIHIDNTNVHVLIRTGEVIKVSPKFLSHNFRVKHL